MLLWQIQEHSSFSFFALLIVVIPWLLNPSFIDLYRTNSLSKIILIKGRIKMAPYRICFFIVHDWVEHNYLTPKTAVYYFRELILSYLLLTFFCLTCQYHETKKAFLVHVCLTWDKNSKISTRLMSIIQTELWCININIFCFNKTFLLN